MKQAASTFLLLLATLFWAGSAHAISIRGGSNLGTGAIDFADCYQNTSVTDPDDSQACEAFYTDDNSNGLPVPTGTVMFNGLSYNVYEFVQGSDDITPGTIYDIVDLGSISADTTFSLPGPFDSSSTAVFTCEEGSSTGTSLALFTSNADAPMAGPCTQYLDGTDATITENPDGSFTTDSGFNVTNLVLEVPAPVADAPEPSTLSLLALGLCGAVLIRKRALA